MLCPLPLGAAAVDGAIDGATRVIRQRKGTGKAEGNGGPRMRVAGEGKPQPLFWIGLAEDMHFITEKQSPFSFMPLHGSALSQTPSNRAQPWLVTPLERGTGSKCLGRGSQRFQTITGGPALAVPSQVLLRYCMVPYSGSLLLTPRVLGLGI